MSPAPYLMTDGQRWNAVHVGDTWRQKKNGQTVTVTHKDARHRTDGYYSVEFTDHKGIARNNFLPNFLQRHTLISRGGEVPLSLALTRDLATWDDAFLTRLIREAEDVLRARGENKGRAAL